MGDGIYDDQVRDMQSRMFVCFNESDDESDDESEKESLSQTPLQLKTKSTPQETVSTITIDDDDDHNDNDDEDDCDILTISTTSAYSNSSIKPMNMSDDTEFNVKFYLDGKLNRIKSTYQTPLNIPLAQHIQNCKNLDGVFIVRVDDEVINLVESPKSLGLKASTIMEAAYIYDRKKLRAKPGQISLKLQDGNRKNTQTLFTFKNHPIRELKKQYSEMMKIIEENLRFTFDGDPIDDDQSPEDLDMDTDCVIDVFVVQ